MIFAGMVSLHFNIPGNRGGGFRKHGALFLLVWACKGRGLGTDEGVEALAACHKLSHVNLTWAVQVGDAGVTALAAGCPNLEELSLHGIPGITDAAIEALSRHCGRSLHTLDVRGCTGVAGRDKAALLALLPLLTCFQVHK